MTATAAEITSRLQSVHFRGNWGVDALYVGDGRETYVNSVDVTIDGDYRMWYLVEVCDNDHEATEHYFDGPGLTPSETGETWRSYLAVYCGPFGERMFQWYDGNPERFFDTGANDIYDVRKWFIGWVEDTPGKERKYGWA